MIDGFYWHWGSIFFDYIFAFGLLGVTGFFTKGRKNIFIFVLGIDVAGFLRYIMSSLSGVLFFGEYAADAGYADAVWFYSFIVYNLGYNLLSTIACAVCGSLLWPFIIKENN
jgi:thiamine transporter